MAVCRHVMHICGGGDDGRSTGHLTIDGSQTRLTYARESARNGPPPARVRDAKGDGNSGFEHAQEGAAHRGLKKTAFGVPEGFYPDKESGYYFNEESGYYFDADRKLYYHPSTQAPPAAPPAAPRRPPR